MRVIIRSKCRVCDRRLGPKARDDRCRTCLNDAHRSFAARARGDESGRADPPADAMAARVEQLAALYAAALAGEAPKVSWVARVPPAWQAGTERDAA